MSPRGQERPHRRQEWTWSCSQVYFRKISSTNPERRKTKDCRGGTKCIQEKWSQDSRALMWGLLPWLLLCLFLFLNLGPHSVVLRAYYCLVHRTIWGTGAWTQLGHMQASLYPTHCVCHCFFPVPVSPLWEPALLASSTWTQKGMWQGCPFPPVGLRKGKSCCDSNLANQSSEELDQSSEISVQRLSG